MRLRPTCLSPMSSYSSGQTRLGRPLVWGAFSHAGPLRAKAAPVAQAPAAPSRPWPCWVVVDQVHAISPRAPWAPVERVCPLPHTPASGPHRGDGLKASGTKCGRLQRGLQGGGETGGPVGQDVDSTDTVHVPIHTKPLGALSPHATHGETEARRGEKTCSSSYRALVVMPTVDHRVPRTLF